MGLIIMLSIFCCPDLKLVVEVDGDVHYYKEKMIKDRKKDQLLKREDIKVVRIEVMDLEEDYESMIVYLEGVFRDRAHELNIGFEKI